MSWIDTLSNMTRNVGRGALDVFTLGGNELGHKFGGQGYQNIMKPVETGFGANFEAGAVGGGLGQLGGAMGGGSGAMMPYTPTSAPVMGQAGSTLGGGMSSSMNLAPAAGSQMGAVATGTPAAPSAVSSALGYMRGMPSGGNSYQAPASQGASKLSQLYKMFPSLRPGAQLGQSGGFNGR